MLSLVRRVRRGTLTAGLVLASTALLTAFAACAHAQREERTGILDLNKLGRPGEEVARDATSKPLELYAFFEIEPGSAVADLLAGAGYNTAILTHLVGDDGVVFSQDGQKGAIAARKATGDLKDRPNVVVIKTVEDLPADSLDVVLTVRNYHDIPPERLQGWLAGIHRALKPGGVFAVVDVRTEPGFKGRATDLHRIAEETVVEEVTAAGFELEGRSDLLANSEDAYGSSEFGNREATDRMVLKFRKAEAKPAGA